MRGHPLSTVRHQSGEAARSSARRRGRDRRDGDTATVENGAITLSGKPFATPLSRLIRHDDRWWITIPG